MATELTSRLRHAQTMAVSPEFHLMAGCCARHGTPSGRAVALRRAAGPETDWNELLRLVKRHRVAGLVFAALQAAGVKIPAEAGQKLAFAALEIRRQNGRAAAETVALQAAFDEAGIPIRFFKGAVLAQQIYGSLEIKHSKDIDLLVPPAQTRAAVELLHRRGYRLWLPVSRLNDRLWRTWMRFNNEVAMVEPGSGLQVEPHWRMALNPRLLRHLDTTTAGEMVELQGYGPVRTFSAEDNFAYLCVHGAESCWLRFKWLADVHAVAAGLPSGQLEAYFRHAVQLGVGPSVALALALCERLLGQTIPPALQGEIRHSWALRELERRALAMMADPSDQPGSRQRLPMTLLMAWLQGYLGSQVRLMLVGMNDVVALPLPRALHFLYPILRIPLYLIRRARGKYQFPPYPSDALSARSVTTAPRT